MRVETKKLERVETVDKFRTPVRERVKHLNKRSQASPGKFPLMKQQLLEMYFKKKSPKASKARERIEGQPEDKNKTTKTKGTNISPLSGVSGKPGLQIATSKDPGPQSEESGRMWGNEGKKKALKALERWPPDPGSGSKSPKRGKPRKRLQRQATGKDKKEAKVTADIGVLQRWLQREKQGSEAPKTGLGPGKAKE